MKKIILYLFCAVAFVMPSLAQSNDETNLTGEALQTYLSDNDNKAAYIKMLNERVGQSEECQKYGIVVTDVNMVRDSLGESFAAAKSKAGSSVDNPTASWDDADGGNLHVSYKYNYYSVNGRNEKVSVSGIIYLRSATPTALGFGVLNCHPTVSTNKECPTGTEPLDEVVHAMCTENCLVVCPDYCGYGTSSAQQHPYLIEDVTARNCIDGYLAALAYVKDVLKFSYYSTFYTLFSGYSQGGAVAMACHKYYETKLSSTDKTSIKLKRSIIGDGPYSPLTTINQYVTWANAGETLAYPCAIPLIVMAAKDAYDKDCMRTVKVEDYFNSSFLSKTGVIDLLNKKEKTMEEINTVIKNNGFTTLDQILSDKILKVTTDSSTGKKTMARISVNNEGKCLQRALTKNDLIEGWTPTLPMTVLYFSGDKVVPDANRAKIQAKINTGEWNSSLFKFVTATTAYNCQGYWSTYHYVLNDLIDGNPSNWDHADIGTLFYIWFVFGTARTGI